MTTREDNLAMNKAALFLAGAAVFVTPLIAQADTVLYGEAKVLVDR